MISTQDTLGLLSRVAIGTLLALAAVAPVAAYPVPAPVRVRWELDFTPGELRIYVDPTDRQPYWYFTYHVVNKTGKDQIWAPSFVLYTDAGEIMASGQDVPSRVEESISELLGNDLLEMQNEVIGDIHQGVDHAREGLVAWKAQDLLVNELSLFISGISGETARVANPVTGNEVILRKTLQRNYLIPGDLLARGSRPIELENETWVLR